MRAELKRQLLADMEAVGIDTASILFAIKPYHSKFDGQYYFYRNMAVVYFYADKERKYPRRYKELLELAIHEGTHHMMNLETTVIKGKTHSPRFMELYKEFVKNALELNLFDKEYVYES